jgi:hypothetical protein
VMYLVIRIRDLHEFLSPKAIPLATDHEFKTVVKPFFLRILLLPSDRDANSTSSNLKCKNILVLLN